MRMKTSFKESEKIYAMLITIITPEMGKRRLCFSFCFEYHLKLYRCAQRLPTPAYHGVYIGRQQFLIDPYYISLRYHDLSPRKTKSHGGPEKSHYIHNLSKKELGATPISGCRKGQSDLGASRASVPVWGQLYASAIPSQLPKPGAHPGIWAYSGEQRHPVST